MTKGYAALVLHAHLPFVKHPEYEEFLEEDWYFEAVTETYLPLLAMMERLTAEGIPFALNMVITPTLAAMMEDPHHVHRLKRYLGKTLDLACREAARLANDSEFGSIARFYQERLGFLNDLFVNRYGSDLLGAFRRLMDTGSLEIMTCAATHGLLPVLGES